MLNESEWVEIYRYLLQQLEGVANGSLIIEIERAAAARIEENISEDTEFIKRFSRESREDLDSIRLRAPTPREAFKAAVGVLITRLREVPELADRVVEKFGCDAHGIQWHADVSERDQILERGSFSASDFELEEGEREQIEAALKRLEDLLKDQQ